MHWILQENIFNEAAFDVMVATLKRFNIPFSEHKVVPFIGEISPDINPIGPVVCMGTYSLRHLAKKKDWAPGVWDLAEQHFLIQLDHWGAHMLNYECDVEEFQNGSINGRAFVRPIEDTKVFAGAVFNEDEFAEWQHRICVLNEHPNGTTISNDTLIQICSLKQIYSEYRFWIAKGSIITSSLYKMGEKVRYENGAPDTIVKFVRDRVAEWEPDDAFVIDVADTPNGFKIVEINTLNSSGYYAADMQKLVLTLDEIYS